MLDSIIFDIDGTLLDTRAQVRLAWSGKIQELTGAPLSMTDAEFTALFGLPMDAIAQRLFPRVEDPRVQYALAEECYAVENDWLHQHPGTLFPQVAEVLQELSQRLPLYIVSNCQRGYIQASLQPHGLLPLFRGWLCFGDTGTPKALTLQTLCTRHGLKHPIYVGDTLGDEQACLQANIPFVYAAYGFGQAERPGYTIEQFAELPVLCAQLQTDCKAGGE